MSSRTTQVLERIIKVIIQLGLTRKTMDFELLSVTMLNYGFTLLKSVEEDKTHKLINLTLYDNSNMGKFPDTHISYGYLGHSI